MIEPDEYCRALEAYLCRKNDGHLIRIVGPAFEQVSGWAGRGIPLKVAEAGIDRYFERYYRKGPRRRPVRIEFCEPDVLDAFDDWRRAVGVSAAAAPQGEAGDEGERRRGSLAAHVETVVARLTRLRGSDRLAAPLGDALAAATRALDGLQAEARRARGDAREALVARLAALEQDLEIAARAALPPADLARLEREADDQLAPFKPRMTPDAFAQARAAAIAGLVRDTLGLPRIAYE